MLHHLPDVAPIGGSIVLNSGLIITSGSVTITAATYALSYTVYISTTTSTAQSVHNFTTQTTGSAVSFTPSPNLSPNTAYYAVLVPTNNIGNGTTSFSSSVTTPPLPTGGSIVLDSGLTFTTGSVTISAATNATGYKVYISRTTSIAQSVHNFTTATTGSSVSFTTGSILTASTLYYAVLVPYNSSGDGTTSYSAGVTSPPLPTGGSIVLDSGLTFTTGSVTITAATNATGYKVYISTTTSIAQSVHNFTTTTTASSVPFTTGSILTASTLYYAVLIPYNVGGDGATSYSAGVTSPPLPTGGSIVLDSGLALTTGSVTITAASNATGYNVYISTTTSTAQSVYNFTTPTTGSSVAFTPSPSLLSSTTYYAILIPYNTGGNGSTSFSASVTTPAALYSFTGTLTFTPAGATGQLGPTLSQCRTAYASFGAWVSDNAFFNMTTQGNQRWTVPQTRNYTITCAGAGAYGSGAIITTVVNLAQGTILNLIVGHTPSLSGNGAGGSFVINVTTSTLLIASGGGGGAAAAGGAYSASLTTSGVTGSGGAGGTNGSAGSAGNGESSSTVTAGPCSSSSQCQPPNYPAAATTTSYSSSGGGGGGGNPGLVYSANYTTFGGGGYSYSYSGTCYYNIWQGTLQQNGTITYECYPYSSAGASGSGVAAGGGGGGYSGGGGGRGQTTNGTSGGGGGSFCSTTITSSSLTNTGNGYIAIT